ncbi:flagellar hook-basal body complex protein FliE [Nitratiruptor sp. YY09-18]|uniref:flagellar hook-basal body complex protein FliE n=1 Tax=Nitratiruptor sp. YY09-18 TaxID=2724901 RepID=UPI001915407B|nr:flagellar hook-basal body complex protein FliE [Nitratiruptor sp. YY09-18]BCD68387.1 flagellar hook-basal body complex protein FliE [Nitratiruptor sp. YY09-18]
MKIENISAVAANNLQNIQQKQNQSDFGEILGEFIADVNSDLKAASKAQEQILKGDVENMVELMTTIEKSDISLRLLTEVRNKALEAYQEIMRIQV